MRNMISAVILTKNEEKNIERCLKSIKWCNEIIIIDDGSLDRTVEIAKKYKSTIYFRKLGNDFSSQRNFGLSKAKNEWIMFVDADEVVSDALAYEISNVILIADQDVNGYHGFYIKRTDFLWGKLLMYGETGKIKFLRLAKRNSGEWEGMAHEEWKIKGKIGELKNSLMHFPHQTFEEFLREINLYTSIRARELKSKNVKSNFLSILFFPIMKFIFNYFIKAGFMDGIRGLIFAITMSFHSFLVRGKLFLIKNEHE
jgi:glycosyltransferase involved in cell wall biosynthesis